MRFDHYQVKMAAESHANLFPCGSLERRGNRICRNEVALMSSSRRCNLPRVIQLKGSIQGSDMGR